MSLLLTEAHAPCNNVRTNIYWTKAVVPLWLTLQLEDGMVWSTVHSSDGISSTVVPQPLENPGRCDDWGCPAGGPPLIGHRGANCGAQSSQATDEGQNLQGGHFLSNFKKEKRNENCCRPTNYTVDMCFIEMIYRQDISRGQWWTQGSQSEIVKGACVDS